MDVTLFPTHGQGPDPRSSRLPYQMPQHLLCVLPELLPIPSLWPSTVQPQPGAWCVQCCPRKEGHRAGGDILPSRSSMVFSSFATDLSANSARVSACEKHSGKRVSCRTLHSKSAPFADWYTTPEALLWERQGTRSDWGSMEPHTLNQNRLMKVIPDPDTCYDAGLQFRKL